jgi:hypothetical protein
MKRTSRQNAGALPANQPHQRSSCEALRRQLEIRDEFVALLEGIVRGDCGGMEMGLRATAGSPRCALAARPAGSLRKPL